MSLTRGTFYTTQNAGLIITDEVKQWLVTEITNNAESTFNQYYDTKVSEFNKNVEEQTKAINDNAQEKMDEYNTNAEELTNRITTLESEKTELQLECKRLREDNQALAIVGQESGENITLNDSSDARFKKFEIGGNYSQATREGYNLGKYNVETKTVNGVTFTHNKDDSMTINGTPTGYIWFNMSDGVLLKAGTYTFAIEYYNLASGDDQVQVINKTLDKIIKNIYPTDTVQSNKKVVEFTLEEDTVCMLRYYCQPNATINNQKLYPMIIKGTYTVGTLPVFEPYGAMPSLEFESPVKAVWGDVNIFNWETITLNKTMQNSGNIVDSNYNFVSDFIEIKPNTKYTVNNAISCVYEFDENKTIIGVLRNSQTGGTVTTSSNAKYLRVRNYYSNGDLLALAKTAKLVEGTKILRYSPYGMGSVEIEICNNNYIELDFKNDTDIVAGLDFSHINNKFTLKGTATGTYYIFKLNKIPNLKNTMYTLSAKVKGVNPKMQIAIKFISTKGELLYKMDINSNNKYIQTVDFNIDLQEVDYANFIIEGLAKGETYNLSATVQLEEGTIMTDHIPYQSQTKVISIQQEMLEGDKFIKQDGKWYEAHYHPKMVFDGTEIISKYDNRFHITIKNIVYESDAGSLPKLLCNKFKAITRNDIYFSVEGIATNKNLIMLYSEATKDMTETDFKSWLAQQYENGTPLIIYPTLETPNQIPCTPEQSKILDEIEQELHTYKTTTHIAISSGEINAIANVEYLKDTETYIENKINAVANAVIELGGTVNV